MKPNVPFKLTANKEEEEYEVYSHNDNNKEHQGMPHVANGIISPNDNLQIQIANLSKATIKVSVGQKLAIMSRMNYEQINAINHLTNTNEK